MRNLSELSRIDTLKMSYYRHGLKKKLFVLIKNPQDKIAVRDFYDFYEDVMMQKLNPRNSYSLKENLTNLIKYMHREAEKAKRKYSSLIRN